MTFSGAEMAKQSKEWKEFDLQVGNQIFLSFWLDGIHIDTNL